ncbi:MAG: dTMP kinase [Euryarchaeota archaeon]|nr:dTMP kinase [Euryarchaeota archaeon]
MTESDRSAPARLVSFEGIDGAGKSTLIAGVAEALRTRGVDPLVTREETTGWLGEAVRRSIDERMDPLATLFLFLADRAHHLAALRPELARGRLVLTDRYHDSTRAYQAVTLADRFDDLDGWLKEVSHDWLITPLRTYLVDIDPEVAVGRMADRGSRTNYEKAAFLGKVRSEYLRIVAAEPERFVVLDGTRPTVELVRVITADLETLGALTPSAAVDG